ncbi:MAG: T9SS type A sorting domain-containing protein [Bacteroidetes bacterium]|nr:T9SS type A sorting domain-containing protein [Bacteroidota bacterium]
MKTNYISDSNSIIKKITKIKSLYSTRGKFLSIAFCLLLSMQVQAQLINIPVSGFYNDIVADGVGTNTISGITHTTIGVDGARYYFIDNTYKYSSSSNLPSCFMPTSGLAPSMRTPGLTYQLQSYASDNALTIDNNSTAYTTSPFPNSAALTLVTPASYSKLYVLYESVINVAPLAVDVLVTFTDATSQSFNNNTCVNWFTATLPTFNNVGRGTPSGNIECGTQPNLFELQLTLSAPNSAKQVQSITFTIPTSFTIGAFPYSVNYFHAMAVGGQISPLGLANGSATAPSINIYPNPAKELIQISTNSFNKNTYFMLYDLAGREVTNQKIESNFQSISLSQLNDGIFYYKIVQQGEILKTGKLNHCSY